MKYTQVLCFHLWLVNLPGTICTSQLWNCALNTLLRRNVTWREWRRNSIWSWTTSLWTHFSCSWHCLRMIHLKSFSKKLESRSWWRRRLWRCSVIVSSPLIFLPMLLRSTPHWSSWSRWWLRRKQSTSSGRYSQPTWNTTKEFWAGQSWNR